MTVVACTETLAFTSTFTADSAYEGFSKVAVSLSQRQGDYLRHRFQLNNSRKSDQAQEPQVLTVSELVAECEIKPIGYVLLRNGMELHVFYENPNSTDPYELPAAAHIRLKGKIADAIAQRDREWRRNPATLFTEKRQR